MQESIEKANLEAKQSLILQALEASDIETAQHFLDHVLSPAETAHILESTPSKVRQLLWDFIDEEHQGDVLTHLNEELQQFFLGTMTAEEIIETTQDLDSDDIADLLQQMPSEVSNSVLELMPSSDRQEIEGLLAYPEDTAGGLMTTELVKIRADVSMEAVLRYLRKIELPEALDVLWVTDRNNRFQGALALTTLLQSKPEVRVQEVLDSNIKAIPAMTPEVEVAQLFERHDWVSAPVVNDSGILIGRITIDDVVDVIIDSADHNMMSMAGLDEESDTFSPIVKSSRDRGVWLGINMITAFIAAAVMSRFEASIAQIVALAVLSPVVASMGGIAGSQTLTLMIRGMAIGHIGRNNLMWMVGRELGVGLLNGMMWALVIGTITVIWYQQWNLALVIGAAIWLNICIAVLSGTLLPFLLKSVNIDPALSGSVILTTITDVFGFLTFLGLATLFLL